MWANKTLLCTFFSSLSILAGAAVPEEFVPDTLAEPVLPESRIFSEGASRAKWVWFPEFPAQLPQKAFFRYRFTLPEEPKSVSFRFVAEKKAVFYLNGHKLTAGRFVPQGQQNLQVRTLTDMAQHLKKGENLLAIEAESSAKIAGVIAAWDVKLKSGKHLYFGTTQAVKVTLEAKNGWNTELSYTHESSWKTPRILGDAWSLPWSREDEMAKLLSLDDDLARQKHLLEKALTLPDSLKKEPEKIRAGIVYSGKTPGIQINGKVLPPFIMIHRETPLFFKEADVILKSYKKGVRFFDVLCRTDRAYVKPGVYDFRQLEQEIRRVLHLAPEGYVIINLRVHNMPGFLEKYPEEAVGYRTGSDTYPRSDDLFGKRPRRPSSASLKMRTELKNMIELLGKQVTTQPWGKRVAGVRISYGVYSEWQLYGHRTDMPDCGPAMQRAFREYLLKKYKTDAELQAAWGDPKVTLKMAEGPTLEEFKAQKSFIIDPTPGQNGRKFADHYDCMVTNVADLLLFMGKCVKDSMPGRLVGAYYGYMLTHSYAPCGQHVSLEKILTSPYVDFLSQPYGYAPELRAPGGNANFAFPTIFRRHKKLLVTEADIRTHLSWTWKEKKLRCNTPEETEAVAKRDIGNSLINGTGIQFLHFGGTYEYKNPNWFNTTYFLEPLGKGVEIWRKLFATPAQDIAEVAFILQPEDKVLHGMPEWRSGEYASDMLYYISWQNFTRSGIPFDFLTMKDYLLSKRDYKAVIFLNAFTLDQAQRTALKQRVRKKGVIAFWYYAPGIADGNKGLSEKAMEDLTGIRLKIDLKGGLLTVISNSNIVYGPRNSKIAIVPRIYADDKEGEVLGKYRQGNQPALVRKKTTDGAYSVFSGTSISNPRVLVSLLKQAGVKIPCEGMGKNPPGAVFRADSRCIMIHTPRGGGKYSVTLPEQVKTLTDVFTGKNLEAHTGRFEISDRESRTHFLFVEPEK